MSELRVLIADESIGLIHQGDGGRLMLTYEEGWHWRADAYPISLLMPLTRAVYQRRPADRKL